jgi:hypothetical protein
MRPREPDKWKRTWQFWQRQILFLLVLDSLAFAALAVGRHWQAIPVGVICALFLLTYHWISKHT